MEKPGLRVCNKKTMRMPGLFMLICVLASCAGAGFQEPQPQQTPSGQIAGSPSTIGTIPLPAGYKRIPAASGSYTGFLRSISLKKDKTVYLYHGGRKSNQSAQYAVIDLDAGTKDLQQCADAVMRIRAEYLYHKKDYSAIRFSFTNGFDCDFNHYAQGYRLSIHGGRCAWVKKAAESYAYLTFRQYLDVVYAYAGTKSLHGAMKTLVPGAIQPGAVFIQTRNPYGHAVTVMDMAVNTRTNDTIFLLSQSYMPAQDIHVLVNPDNDQLSPWYSVRGGRAVETPEWTFTWDDLKTF